MRAWAGFNASFARYTWRYSAVEDRVRAECNSGAPSVLHVASRVRLRVHRPTGGRHGHTVSPGSGRAVVVEGGVVGGCMMGTLPS